MQCQSVQDVDVLGTAIGYVYLYTLTLRLVVTVMLTMFRTASASIGQTIVLAVFLQRNAAH